MLLTLFVYAQCAMFSLSKPARRQAGQGLVEYALIIGLIAIVLVAVLTTMRGSLNNVFRNIGNNLNNVT